VGNYVTDNPSNLRNYVTADTYEEWLQRVRYLEHKETLPEGYVPSSTYLAIRKADQRLVGMLAIRHWLNEALKFEGGHIGYGVRVSERRKGYSTEMLQHALSICAELRITKALLTCRKDNVGSASVIKANGGCCTPNFQTMMATWPNAIGSL
jgi:predicted acetyltransferase